MRADELAAAKEQRKHLLVELRSLTGRYPDGQAWSDEAATGADELRRHPGDVVKHVDGVTGNIQDAHRAVPILVEAGQSTYRVRNPRRRRVLRDHLLKGERAVKRSRARTDWRGRTRRTAGACATCCER